MEGLDNDLRISRDYWTGWLKYCDKVERDLMQVSSVVANRGDAGLIIGGVLVPGPVLAVAAQCRAMARHVNKRLEQEHGLRVTLPLPSGRNTIKVEMRRVAPQPYQELTMQLEQRLLDLQMEICQWDQITKAVIGFYEEVRPKTGEEAALLAGRLLRQLPEQYAHLLTKCEASDNIDEWWRLVSTVHAGGYSLAKLSLRGATGGRLRRALSELQGSEGETELVAEVLAATQLAASEGIKPAKFPSQVEAAIRSGTDAQHKEQRSGPLMDVHGAPDRIEEFVAGEEAARQIMERAGLTVEETRVMDLLVGDPEMSNREIAAELGKKKGTVDALRARAKAKLRKSA